MTNPNDSIGTNGAYGGRTSVNALNDVLASFSGRGIISGWATTASSGMTVNVGGAAGVRDVAIAEDNNGNRTTVDNRSSSPVAVEIAAASSSATRIDCVVAYVNNPPSVLVTTIDNPSACGIIAVQGTTSAPDESAIRSAITADGGTGSTAYYVVLATITIPAGTTDLTNTNIASAGAAGAAIPTIGRQTLQSFNNTYANTSYTANARGFLRGKMFVNAAGRSANVFINGVTVAGIPYASAGGDLNIQMVFVAPVAVGDLIELSTNGGGFEELVIKEPRWI